MKKISSEEISKYTSLYLTVGRKKESWSLDDVEMEGDALHATISMNSIYSSPTDIGGFHLSIFPALEFVSQLIIIYFHVWAGLSEKTQEAWMIESKIRYQKVIRSHLNIKVSIKVRNIKKVGKRLYSIVEFKITDDLDGIFEGEIKAFIA